MSTTDNDPNVNVSQSQQHQDGIDHITSHSAAGGSAPTPSNPGSDDPTGGIASGHGGGSVNPAFDSSMPSHRSEPQQGSADPSVDESMPSTTANPHGTAAHPADVIPDEPREGGDENVSHAKKDNWPKENRDAIPTAGGERLGEKHWGESDVVPDAGKPQAKENISSSSGQPDAQTANNTSANTGGAPAPSSGSASAANDADKPKLMDKMKDKLHMGSK